MAAGVLELWQYTDERGTLVVVDALDKVPPARREAATKVVLEAKPTTSTPTERALDIAGLHWPSFGAGVVLALGVFLLSRVIWSGAKVLLKIAAFAAVAALLVAGYFGFVRQQAGLGSGPVSPAALVDDAQRAADQAKKMIDNQARDLRKIETP